jgi:hypothetical protein
MNQKELDNLLRDFTYQTGLKADIDLLFTDVVITPILQKFNVLNLRAIEGWITDRFYIEGQYAERLPTLTMIPMGQSRYEMGIRLSQTQAVKMMNINRDKFALLN